MQGNPVGWFEIYVQDMNRAKTFYEAVFGAKLEKLDDVGEGPEEMWGFPMAHESSGCSGALVKMAGVPSSGGGTIVYFVCDDCSVEADKVQQNGGGIHKSKMPIGKYGFIALAADTEGNMIGLHSMK